jgi:hypothetical protein
VTALAASALYCRDRAAEAAAIRRLTIIATAVAVGFAPGVGFGIMLAREFAPWMN